jgi:hypothetical protein
MIKLILLFTLYSMPHVKVNGDLTIAIRAGTVNDMTLFYTRMISYDGLGGA